MVSGPRVGLIYLSLTGNTKTMSEWIGRCLSRQGCTVRTYDLMEASNRRRFPLSVDPEFLAQADVVGVGALTAVYQPMYFLVRLLKGIRGLEGKGVFVYCCYGVDQGRTLKGMRSALRRSGATFLGGDAFASSDEVKELTLNGMYIRHDQPNDEQLRQADQLVRRVLANYAKLAAGGRIPRTDTAAPRGRRFFALLGRFVYREGLIRYLRRFRIDSERCTGCGWCIEVCPSLSLSFRPGVSVPVVDSTCQGCALCFECPHKAIRPALEEFGVRLAGRWARWFYTAAPRKVLDPSQIEMIRADRFSIMKSRPELMGIRARELEGGASAGPSRAP